LEISKKYYLLLEIFFIVVQYNDGANFYFSNENPLYIMQFFLNVDRPSLKLKQVVQFKNVYIKDKSL